MLFILKNRSNKFLEIVWLVIWLSLVAWTYFSWNEWGTTARMIMASIEILTVPNLRQILVK